MIKLYKLWIFGEKERKREREREMERKREIVLGYYTRVTYYPIVNIKREIEIKIVLCLPWCIFL